MNAVLQRSGVYDDLDNDAYHADRSAVSSTGLKHMLRSPAHYKAYIDGQIETSAAKELGTAIHCAILEPEKFKERFVVAPRFDRRTNAGKAAAEAFEIENFGKQVITKDESQLIQFIQHAVLSHKTARELLARGTAEKSVFWTDKRTGLMCKIRPDWLHPAAICDVKSAVDASPMGFSAACARMHYDLSAYMYRLGMKAVTGKDMPFIFIALEKDVPYCPAVYMASETMLNNGRLKFERAMDSLKMCLETGLWPGYQADGRAQEIDLPRWAILNGNMQFSLPGD